jgi:hypothetical protein
MIRFFRVCFIVLFILNTQTIYSQKNVNISGCITDSISGEKIQGVIIFIKELSTGCITNDQGIYSISLPKGIYNIEYRFVGYKPTIKSIMLEKDTKKDIILSKSSVEIDEVTVSDNSYQQQKRMLAGIQKIDMKSIENIPVLFGEGDILKKVQLMPGIVSAVEGDNALYVRGSSSDQNLILLDGANVFNPSHLYGIISVFNPDLIKDMTLYKGGIPIQYGGRISSLLEINTIDGDFNKFHSSGDIGVLSGRISVNGPLIKNKVSIVAGARRSYTDLILKPFFRNIYNQYKFNYYDLNAKITILEKNDKITFSGYLGNDNFNLPLEQGVSTTYGNKLLSNTWYHWFNNNLFFNLTNYYSNYSYSFYTNNLSNLRTNTIEEGSSKILFNYSASYRSEFSCGLNLSVINLSAPIYKQLNADNVMETLKSPDLFSQYAINNSIFVNHMLKLGKVKFDYGLRYIIYNNLGPGKVINYKIESNPESGTIDTVSYKRFQNIKQYSLFEPRINMSILLNSDNILKINYCKTSQFYQQIPSYTATVPGDMWVIANAHIKPQIGNQISLGYNKSVANNNYEFNAEIYYKWMENQLDLKTGGTLFGNSYYETELLSGTAYSYGSDVMLEKKGNVLSGWISYSFLNAKRHIIGINNNIPYSPFYDIRHNIAIVLNYKFNKRATLSCDWNFHTGAAVTFPNGIVDFNNKALLYYDPDKRNSDRMPDYNRLDISFILKNKGYDTKWFKSKWIFSIYNVYGKTNPYFYTFTVKVFNQTEGLHNQYISKMTYIFYIIPSISYNFNF